MRAFATVCAGMAIFPDIPDTMEANPPTVGSADPGSPATADTPAYTAPPLQAQDRSRLPLFVERLGEFLHGKANLLWWLHSAYALLFGLMVMWLSSRNFAYLRIIVFHITFIWLTSLFLPVLVRRPWLPPKWRERLRLAINYFNKNFYQQLLFFLLPVYYASTTFGSRNMVFLILLALSALLSTLDIIYDRYLSVRWSLTALFFVFNLFAAINVMLPVLWAISNRRALWVSGALALGGFASMLYRLSGLRGRSAKMLLGGAALGLLLIVGILPSFIPPAPLCLVSAEFGTAIRSLRIDAPLTTIPSSPGKLVALTAIKAPMGLEEEVRHRWYLNGELLFVSGFHTVTGGRNEGYRLWSQITNRGGLAGRVVTVDVETKGGQLIGRARLKT
jgi:hypothetical protein